jgi:hypothetical protein
MLRLRRGTVTAIVEREEGLVRLEVDGAPCIAYPQLTGTVALGDDVIVNVAARELALGSGGFDVLHANLTRGLDLQADADAHVMKLPYTSLQHAVRHGEEEAEPAEVLDGMPVVCCSLHSQVAPVCAALDGRRVAYLQLPGGALPVALSDTARELKKRGLVELTIGVGACFGGDVDCVNVYSGLGLAHDRGFEVAVCGIGPGIVGTGTSFGHGGMAVADAAFAAKGLGGRPIIALRMSDADLRERHRGVSHHTDDVLSLSGASWDWAWPVGHDLDHPARDGGEPVDVSDWREVCAGLPLSHMGRGPGEDPWFFAAAFAAGRLAARLVD